MYLGKHQESTEKTFPSTRERATTTYIINTTPFVKTPPNSDGAHTMLVLLRGHHF